MRPARGLRSAIASGSFVVTAEIAVPRGADGDAIITKAGLLRGSVDAVNLTDAPSATVMMSSLASARLVLDAGVEPVMQLTCRDRNRIALQSDLIAADALGIPNVLLLTGDHPTFGDHPDAKAVFDLDSIQLLGTARGMRDDGVLLSGRQIVSRPSWLVGAVENPFAPPQRFRAARLAKKVAAGAEFVQTQFVFDVEGFAGWMHDLRDRGIEQRCAILPAVGPIRSRRALDFVRSKVPGVFVPDDVDKRLRAVPADKVAEHGVRLCVETIQRLREIPGVRGVHLMAFGREGDVPEILERAGVPNRTAGASQAVSAVFADEGRS